MGKEYFNSRETINLKRYTNTTNTNTNNNNNNNNNTIEGYAIVYNVLTSDRGGYFVRFAKNSAKPCVEVHALYAHNERDIIGNTSNSTLRITPDSYGVWVSIDLPNTTVGNDVKELVENCYVNGMSFGLLKGTSKQLKENGKNIVEYSEYFYDEVTITSIPAVIETTIGVKRTEEMNRKHTKLALARFQLNHLKTLKAIVDD